MQIATGNPRDVARRGRAVGAMFFTFFGGAWLAAWNYLADPQRWLGYVIIGVLAVVLFVSARSRYRYYDAALAGQVESPAMRRRQRWFQIINVAQWVLILITGNVLANLGLGAWVIPAVALIVGLHFLPLAHLFDYRGHYLTGAAFILLALIVPRIAAGGPADPVLCLCAGLVLWVSALLGLLAA